MRIKSEKVELFVGKKWSLALESDCVTVTEWKKPSKPGRKVVGTKLVHKFGYVPGRKRYFGECQGALLFVMSRSASRAPKTAKRLKDLRQAYLVARKDVLDATGFLKKIISAASLKNPVEPVGLSEAKPKLESLKAFKVFCKRSDGSKNVYVTMAADKNAALMNTAGKCAKSTKTKIIEIGLSSDVVLTVS